MVTEDLFQIVSLPSVAIVGANQIIIQSKEQDYLLDRIKTITFSKKVDDIIAAQLPKSMFMKHCDRVIDNSNTFEETKIQLDKIVADL